MKITIAAACVVLSADAGLPLLPDAQTRKEQICKITCNELQEHILPLLTSCCCSIHHMKTSLKNRAKVHLQLIGYNEIVDLEACPLNYQANKYPHINCTLM